jgi:hypothetical protein
MDDKRHAPATLPPAKKSGTQHKGEWVCLMAGPDSCGKSHPYRDMIPGRPIRTRNLLNPWSKVLLEKLTGLQLVKKFPAFYGTRRFITAFTSARRLSPHQSISPGPRQVYVFRNKASFYGEELLTPLPTPMLDHHMSAVHECLFNIFPATLQIGGLSSIRNLYTLHAVVTGTRLSLRTQNRHSKSRRRDAVCSVVKSQNTEVKLRASVTVNKHVGGIICTIWIGWTLADKFG